MGQRNPVKSFLRTLFLILITIGWAARPTLAQSQADLSPSQQRTPTAVGKESLLENKEGLKDIQKKIKEEKKKEKQAELKEKHVLNRIHKVDITLHKIRKAKETNQAVLQQSQAESTQLQKKVEGKQEELEQSRQMLIRRLRDLYRASFHHPLLGGLLEADNVTDLARKLKFGIMLARSNEKLLARILQDEDRLRKVSTLWAVEANQKQRLLNTLDRKEKNYDREQKNRTASLENIRKQKEQQEATIRQLNESAHQLQNKVSQILAEAAREEKRQKLVVSAQASTKTRIKPNGVERVVSRTEGKGLRVIQGLWPVTGRIISYFGKSKDPQFHLEVDNSGIQIQAAEGTPIHAVASGVVKFADWFKGYGKLVILDHGRGYYSLYAQAATLNVSEGQSVASGQVLGSVGDTDSLVGSSLYFEIRKNGVPQDPLHWLKYRN
jgi:septal ring factor EnvC (AmiA/AmiB activator)